MALSATVHLIPGAIRRGLWCDTCQLSTCIEVSLYAVRNMDSLGSLPITKIRKCINCDRKEQR